MIKTKHNRQDNGRNVLSSLSRIFTVSNRDPIWGSIRLSPEMITIIRTPVFAKLGRIGQLGPARFIYPGATHTRLAHSIGVFYMAWQLLQALGSQVLPGKGKKQFQNQISFLLAALCHDLGHFPYAHSLKELPLEEHEVLTRKLLEEESLRSLLAKAGEILT